MAELIVQIKSIRFTKESRNGHWCILMTDAGCAKGETRWIPNAGEQLKLQGEWVTFQGQKEFKFSHAMPHVPDNPKAQLHYVCTMADGIGPALEERIWDEYADNWKHIEPDTVKGVSSAKYKSFVDAISLLDQSQDYIQALTWMLSIGMTHNMADAAWSEWDKDTIGVIKDDPYKLSMLQQYGFKDADKLRAQFGISDDDERRIRASTFYVMLKAERQGDTVVSWETLVIEYRHMISADIKMVNLLRSVTAEMIKNTGELIGWSATGMLAMGDSYRYEKSVWDYVNGITEEGS
jgi:hypothetical protein